MRIPARMTRFITLSSIRPKKALMSPAVAQRYRVAVVAAGVDMAPRILCGNGRLGHMIAGVLKETFPGERRVATVPSAMPALTKAGVQVVLESGAGTSAGFRDSLYADKGARILAARQEVLDAARLVLQVRPLAGIAGRPDG